MSKSGKGGPGRALVKHHNQLVTEAKKQGYSRNKRLLESVTDVKDVEVVIEEAEEAGRLFSAQNPEPNLLISLDLNSSNNGLTLEENKEQQKAEEALYIDSIQIPRRPPWYAKMSTEELDARERQSFLNWRRSLARLEENEKLVFTPFEKNIEIWRQLWRVLERSDLVVTVVDARNPLFYRCCDLESYVREIEFHKRTMLLVNKADLLPVYIRQKWAKYFHSQGILYIFWSAKAASAALEGKEHRSHLESCIENPEELQKLGVSAEDIKIYGREELLSRLQKEAEEISAVRKASTETNKGRPILNQSSNINSAYSESDVLIENPIVLDSSRRVVVGFVGYPNVGKSSTINALVGQKRTGVTSTPGKTKHFQTLIISDRLMLCDCPGLVFPSFSSSRHEMVASGVLPIDRLTDHRGAIQIVADRVPRSNLENIYRISLPKPKPYEPQDRPPAAFELLRTYSQSRGYVGTGGLPDETRAARQILKDYIDGKLPHFELPPEEAGSVDGEETSSTSPMLQTEDCRMGPEDGALELHDDQVGSSASSAEEEGGRDLDDQVYSTINEEVETKGKLLSVMGSSSLEGVLHELDSFDSVNDIKTATPGKRENGEKVRAPHKMHKKTQRKKDRSWRVGNDESDGMPAAKAVQKPVSYGASRVL